ncbi:arginase family protein [Rubrivivax gelatinosus]|uniref:Arginase n=1 Tax=Rubrivivax gelatinosus TaxID=28068 RepID=A0A4R2M5H4_RUBGE|nr:arginase family protein [Rubrivivax gelatinosus]TCP01291.1 arginase [Rubrivivax gelatinosus]
MLEVLAFQGRVGDHNELAIPGARAVAAGMAARLGLEVVTVGTPEPVLNAGWDVELERARPALEQLRAAFDRLYARGARVAAATSRCAASIATLPVIARHRPDACVVWFDAHADLNTPHSSLTGYLGGLALAAPLGLWDSGLGAGLATDKLILVGQRDLDPFETELIRRRSIRCIPPGPTAADELLAALDGRPVYVHLDCDVLAPGIVPTDYVHDGGLSLADLQQCARRLARSEVVGLEVAEFQCAWHPEGQPVSAAPLVAALSPLLAALQSHGRVPPAAP